MINIDQLNFKAAKFLDGLDIGSTFQAKEYHTDDSVTIFPDDHDAFNLNPIVSGAIKEADGTYNPRGAVARVIVSYAWACRAVLDDRVFAYGMSLVLNSMLVSLTHALGNLYSRKITAVRPGTTLEFFRELENSAGYEFRLVVLPDNAA